jgi:hypothetical protein
MHQQPIRRDVLPFSSMNPQRSARPTSNRLIPHLALPIAHGFAQNKWVVVSSSGSANGWERAV